MNKLCNLLEDYLQENLDKKNREIFEKHLEKCESCRKSVEGFAKIEKSLNSIPKVSVPDDFSASVMERIYARKEKILGWYFYGITAFLSFILSAVVVYLLGFDYVAEKVYSVVSTVYAFASSFSVALSTLSGSLYNSVDFGGLNGVVLTFVFVMICFGFAKSVKIFTREVK